MLKMIVILWSLLMASQGPNSGSTAANDTTVGSVAWTGPSDALTSNNIWSYCFLSSMGPQSNYLKITGFGFSVPSGATIDRIVVEVERHASAIDKFNDYSAKLVIGGTITGNDKADATHWPTSDTYLVYDYTTAQWGVTVTDTDINASNFGFVLSANWLAAAAPQAFVDHVRITIYYTAAAPPVAHAVLIDGFEHADSAAWSPAGGNGNSFTVITTSPRCGKYHAQCKQNPAGWSCWRTFTGQTNFVSHAGIRFATSVPASVSLLSLGSDATNPEQIRLQLDASSKWQLRDNNGTLYTAASGPSADVWTRIELRVKSVAAGSDELELRVDGTQVINTAAASIQAAKGFLRLYGTLDGLLWDDVCLVDGNTFPGNVNVVELKLESIATDSATWTVDGTGTKYDAIQDRPLKPGLPRLISSSSADLIEFNLSDPTQLQSSDTVYGVALLNLANAVGSIDPGAYGWTSGATPARTAATAGILEWLRIDGVDPNTAAAWTVAAIRALLLDAKTSNGVSWTIRWLDCCVQVAFTPASVRTGAEPLVFSDPTPVLLQATTDAIVGSDTGAVLLATSDQEIAVDSAAATTAVPTTDLIVLADQITARVQDISDSMVGTDTSNVAQAVTDAIVGTDTAALALQGTDTSTLTELAAMSLSDRADGLAFTDSGTHEGFGLTPVDYMFTSDSGWALTIAPPAAEPLVGTDSVGLSQSVTQGLVVSDTAVPTTSYSSLTDSLVFDDPTPGVAVTGAGETIVGGDSAAVQASLDSSDTVAGSDASAFAAAIAGSETLVGADVAGVSLATTDLVVAVDSAVLSAVPPAQDSLVFSESSDTRGSASPTELLTGSDVSGVGIATTELAVGADTAAIATAPPTSAELLTITDSAAAPTSSYSQTDSLLFSDVWTSTTVSPTELLTGTDTATAPVAAIAAGDLVVGIDTASVAAAFAAQVDAIVISDAVTESFLVATTDQLVGSDVAGTGAVLTASDALAGTDTASTTAQIPVTDLVLAIDAVTGFIGIISSDAMVLTDLVQPVTVQIPVTDLVTGSDSAASPTAVLTAADSIVMLDVVSVVDTTLRMLFVTRIVIGPSLLGSPQVRPL